MIKITMLVLPIYAYNVWDDLAPLWSFFWVIPLDYYLILLLILFFLYLFLGYEDI